MRENVLRSTVFGRPVVQVDLQRAGSAGLEAQPHPIVAAAGSHGEHVVADRRRRAGCTGCPDSQGERRPEPALLVQLPEGLVITCGAAIRSRSAGIGTIEVPVP